MIDFMLWCLFYHHSSSCGIAVAPLKQEDVSKVCVLHTISKAWSIGRAVERGQRAQQDPIDAILGSVPSKLIFKGKVYWSTMLHIMQTASLVRKMTNVTAWYLSSTTILIIVLDILRGGYILLLCHVWKGISHRMWY